GSEEGAVTWHCGADMAGLHRFASNSALSYFAMRPLQASPPSEVGAPPVPPLPPTLASTLVAPPAPELMPPEPADPRLLPPVSVALPPVESDPPAPPLPPEATGGSRSEEHTSE